MNSIILKLISILNFRHSSSLQPLLNLLTINELSFKRSEVIENLPCLQKRVIESSNLDGTYFQAIDKIESPLIIC